MTANRETLLEQAPNLVRAMVEKVEQAQAVELAALPADRTALIIVDMINGFAREGALASPRVGGLIPTITDLLQRAKERGIAAVAFGDSHLEDSLEFQSYPPHCIAGTAESEVVAELAGVGGYTFLPKNSTNGFIEPGFQAWLAGHPTVDTFVVVGDCTDICVLQFVLTLKTDFTRQNRPVRIIVPVNGVETFDAPGHPGDLLHVAALNLMMGNGIDVVSRID
jgi:nicotinamidase-related amidase